MTDTVTLPRHELAQLEHLVESLEEAALDAQRLLSAEDRGWAKLTAGDGTDVIDRASIMQVAAVARINVAADPLIKRGVNLRIAYLGSPSVSAPSSDDGQDLNAVVQAFWDDPENAETFTSVQACAERERARNTDGNTFHALPTDPRTGRVRVRVIPPSQVTDIITDPEDAATPWLYKRQYTAKRVTQNALGTTSTVTESRTVYYPDVNFRPATRARSIDGHPVEWDKPVVHTAVNRPSESRWGIPDVLAALPWAAGYKDFLQDWAKLHKALATVAFRATAKTRRGAAQVREKFASVPTDGQGVGQVAVTGEGQTFEAVSKSGATIDAGSSKPLAGMVAAALDLPVTMLLSDPGVTGARATAETLDRPLELERQLRRAVDSDLIRTVLGHVIREAVRAPGGPLRGTILRDPGSQREVIDLAGDQQHDITVDWPSLEKVDVKTVMESLEIADGLDVVDPLTIARLVLVALGVDDIDGELDAVKDDNGNFVPPSSRTAVAAQDPGYDGAGNPQG
ncbi:hypothetical protein [Janibacter sp. LM]|uniref:hypothetical protein n=1 Tax=Janibacter sp. LM TaxID=3144845 RepID=UPI0031F71715